jgi:ribosomal protein S18 acetylase RimI-like enzyme
LIFKEVKGGEDSNRLLRKIISEEPGNTEIEMAYPEVHHPSFQLDNYSVRDDSKTILAFEAGQLVGLASLVWSKKTFLPSSFLNRVLFIVSHGKTRNIEDQIIEEIHKIYVKLKVREFTYTRLRPVEGFSPTGRTLGKHGYKKRFAAKRMARTLDNIPKLETESNPTLRRVKWERQDLMLFAETWAKGFGWPTNRIEPVARGLTKRWLERNTSDPNMWINFLVEIDKEPVGTAAFLTYPETAYAVNISTIRKYRKRGIAACAMTSLMKYCKARGMKYMALDVDPKGVAGLALYRKLDFKDFGESSSYERKLHYRTAKRARP